MRKVVLICVLFFLSGCTYLSWLGGEQMVVFDKPKVHLFLYNDYKTKENEFVSALVDGGFEVVLRSGKPPKADASSYIIHSPGLNPDHFQEIDTIIDILRGLGVRDIGRYQYGVVNHSYTPKNMGVYLQ